MPAEKLEKFEDKIKLSGVSCGIPGEEMLKVINLPKNRKHFEDLKDMINGARKRHMTHEELAEIVVNTIHDVVDNEVGKRIKEQLQKGKKIEEIRVDLLKILPEMDFSDAPLKLGEKIYSFFCDNPYPQNPRFDNWHEKKTRMHIV
jgi:hypothetical protein